MNDLNKTDQPGNRNDELRALAKESAQLFFAERDEADCSPEEAYAAGYREIMRGDPNDEPWAELDDDVASATEQFFADDRYSDRAERSSPTAAYEAGFFIAVSCVRYANEDAAAKTKQEMVDVSVQELIDDGFLKRD